MLRSKNIDLNLIKEFAIMRNRLNEKRFFNEYNILKVKNFSQKDDGFCEEGIRKSFSQAQKILKKLNKYKLQEIDDFLEILKELGKNKGGIINDYISMPFAKQHQDFREDNIITDAKGTQKLIDQGSSYGYNPFLYDVAPFVVNNPKALNHYIKYSNNCNGISKEQIQKWLYAALVSRFFDVIKYRLHADEGRVNTREDCKKYLKYELKTYKWLIERKAGKK